MLAVTRLAAAVLCAFAAASAVQAQQRVRPVPNTIPSASARTAQTAPRPTGLTPAFPAGVSSGSGAAVSTDPVAASTSPIPPTSVDPATAGRIVGGTGTSVTAPELDVNAAAAATTVMGAGATVRGPGQSVTGGAGGFSATDQARSFFFADANHDGTLTRAEAARLSIMTLPFEEMDRNFDGLISRFEYDDSLR